MAAPSLDALLETARTLAAEFAPHAAELDRTGAFPFANFERLRDAGLLNVTVPERFGGLGLGLEAACRVINILAAAEPSTALVLGMHYIYHALPAISARWPEHLHERMSRDSVAGIALVNVMRVEPELGTPTRGGLPATTARRHGDAFSVSGHKLYATGSPLLSYFITWARTDDAEPLVGWFMIPAGLPGIRIAETWDHLGMRATGSHDLILEDVEIPVDYALDVRPAAGWAVPDAVGGAWNNLVLSALYLGIAQAARDWLAAYLHERKPTNLGASLATLPRFQSSMGEIEALLWSAERHVFGLAAEADALGYGPRLGLDSSLAKYTATNNAVRAVDIALSLIGNPGLSRTNPLERHHRDVLCSRVHMPQDDMVTLMVGKAALGVR